jgi:hypothetical protein
MSLKKDRRCMSPQLVKMGGGVVFRPCNINKAGVEPTLGIVGPTSWPAALRLVDIFLSAMSRGARPLYHYHDRESSGVCRSIMPR